MALVLIGCLGSVGIASFLMNHDVAAGGILAFAAVFAFAYFLYEGWREEPAIRRRVVVLVALSIFAIVFWSVYVQVGSSFLLFVDRSVDRNILGFVAPATDFLSLNPFFILVMGMPFAALWLWLDKFRLNPSIPLKFVFGFLLIGLSYFVLVWGIATSTDRVAWEWLVLFFFLYTAAEMVLSPVGLAMTTDLAPKNLTGLAMGIWLLATSGGLYVGGVLASVAAVPDGTSAAATKQIYQSGFGEFGWIALATGLLLCALVPWLKHMMRPRAEG
jgi:POT family proton-dependent oligopeptide transporter